MIKVLTEDNSLNSWPQFKSTEEAIKYINDNTGVFEPGDNIAIIDFSNCITTFYKIEFRACLVKI